MKAIDPRCFNECDDRRQKCRPFPDDPIPVRCWNELAGQGKDPPSNFRSQGKSGGRREHRFRPSEQGRGKPPFIERFLRVSTALQALRIENFQGVSNHSRFRTLPEGLDYELKPPLQRHIVSIQQNHYLTFGSTECSIESR